MSDRASIFAAPGLDVSDFKPKQSAPAQKAPAEAIRALAEKSDFVSREPEPKRKKENPPRREARRHLTGRNIQLALKVSQETRDRFYAIADEHGWVLGEALERATLALERELSAAKK